MGVGGLGIGDWGLGQSPIPNPQSPIPNPQSPFNRINNYFFTKILLKNLFFLFINNLNKYENLEFK